MELTRLRLITYLFKAMKSIPTLSRTLALTVPAVALTLGGAHAASDYLLEIDGIKGESKSEKHKDAIEIESLSWGATNTGTAKAITLTLGKRIDKSSPLLFLRCATGEHIPTVKIICKKSTQEGDTDYYVVTLSDCLVSSFQSSGHGGSAGGDTIPTDQISLNYHKIQWTYVRRDDAGQIETTEAEFDFSKTGGAQ
jgi:type VI secretion system secreted protein Hcp